MTKIRDINVGDTVVGFYLLKKIELKQTSTLKDYLEMILSDKTGDVTAKLWDVSSEHKSLTAPTVIKLQAFAQTFKDKLDLKVLKILPANENDPKEDADIRLFIQTAPIRSEVLLKTIQEKIDSLADYTIRSIVQYCFNKAKDKLSYYPAAKSVHHSFYSGLAYHIVRMIELAEFICQQRPFLNRDLLIGSIILHDLGKTLELNSKIGEETTYSDIGKLLGHISIVYGWIVECVTKVKGHVNDFSDEMVVQLQHLVLSHHDKGEWGSPVKPQTAESVALHHIDNIDAKLQAVEDALIATPLNETWTKPITAIDNNSIYKGIGDY